MRKKIVAGNWKMNLSLNEGIDLSFEMKGISAHVTRNISIVLAPSFVHLKSLDTIVSQESRVFLGAQNCSEKDSGAYTGEVSAAILKSCGVDYVIVGHSERREYFNETDRQLAEKTNKILEYHMHPIFCCGESLAERESGQEKEVVSQQLIEGLFHLSAQNLRETVIAYEPVWAIGTGKTPTTNQVQKIHQTIRQLIVEKYGEKIAEEVSILYGGSCNLTNVKELFTCKDVDGGLIGGASLKAKDFINICQSLSFLKG